MSRNKMDPANKIKRDVVDMIRMCECMNTETLFVKRMEDLKTDVYNYLDMSQRLFGNQNAGTWTNK
jgi:hypothetical protein